LKPPTGNAMSGHGVKRKLLVVFALQFGAISIAVILSVFASAFVLQDILIHKALSDEAALFAQRLGEDISAPAPDTVNLKGYFVGKYQEAAWPDFARGLSLGFHDIVDQGEQISVLLKQHHNGTLILAFKQDQAWSLVFYFGLIPLSLVLLVIYVGLWVTYRLSKQAVSPLIRLAKQVESLDLNHIDPDAFKNDQLAINTNQEVSILTQALDHLSQRIQRMMERERIFTRDASHELRTPITVIQMAADMLLDDAALDAYQYKTVRRIKNVTKDMQALTEAFLILARDSDKEIEHEIFSINEVAEKEIQQNEFLIRNKPIRLIFNENAYLSTHGVANIFSIMLGNLIRNACHGTVEGRVEITIGEGHIIVDDTGIGMSTEELNQIFKPFYRAGKQIKGGHGVGLTIVKRLSDRFGWPVEIRSKPDIGTRVTIYFPNYTLQPKSVESKENRKVI